MAILYVIVFLIGILASVYGFVMLFFGTWDLASRLISEASKDWALARKKDITPGDGLDLEDSLEGDFCREIHYFEISDMHVYDFRTGYKTESTT